MKALPTAKALRNVLSYDPETGVFIWKERADQAWNGLWAGKQAFISNTHGYRTGSLFGKRGVLAHRIAWKIVTGEDPHGEIDHINGDRADNRFANLRVVTNQENRRNSARPSTNTSGTVGVCFTKGKGKWKAYIHLNNRMLHLGYFATKEEAAKARAAAEELHGFHPNHGRTLCR